ncbi:hypothetical protein DQQ10_23970 [Pseudochryseolinea flava]|uniref:Uncharacterized protein n=1 Tax=Pseudochryseolinea flava TaxID=2059302 RepID=A0A364XVQ2_9BACT|nr:hypothetical protein DQQ10_23970 [Pseudochryseolinea flava]
MAGDIVIDSNIQRQWRKAGEIFGGSLIGVNLLARLDTEFYLMWRFHTRWIGDFTKIQKPGEISGLLQYCF